jgi:4-hydroxy-tetrahydrodipicolinate reductase
MQPIRVMVNGIPGNVARTVAGHAVRAQDLEILPVSLTGPEIQTTEIEIEKTPFRLIRPHERDAAIAALKAEFPAFISVDYTHPEAVNANADFYCRQGLPFVMGTTGGDRQRLTETVVSSSVSAVIAPNMAKQIVGFQAMMAYAAENFPDLFRGYRLYVRESHQKGKADTSGTAKAMVAYFQKLGLDFRLEDIRKERDPEVQRSRWGIPEEALAGHAWHTYTLVSADDTVHFEFTHNVNGREVYALGTLDAIRFLAAKLAAGEKGRVFTMMDVLKGL